MARLSLAFLGTFQVDLAGEPVTSFESDKVRALLVYLAVESDRPHRRETLAGLLWPERPERGARRNLSQALFKLREAIGDRAAQPPFLTITPQTLQFNPSSDHQLDVSAFTDLWAVCQAHDHRRLEACQPCLERLQGAVALYQGSFLEGFSLGDCAAFEEWALLTRERLGRLGLGTLQHLAEGFEARGEYEQALSFAWRWLELDPWQETAHRQVMRLLALSGQREAALAQYQTCRRILAQELDAEPSPETTVLYQRLQESVEEPAHNLPIPVTSFLGRAEELARIARRLETPTCRLLTLVGPGGIGKTRLALEAARQQLTRFRQGIYFAPLIAVDSADRLILTISQALNLPFQGPVEPKTQLLQYLRHRELLLVLDSIEHLLAPPRGEKKGGAVLLVEMMQAAPGVKILVTSRQRLNLSGEWAMPVEGLPVPDSAEPTDVAASSAVQLFVERGRQVRPEFTLSDRERPPVARLCRLVDGMPLAIELAAGWLKLLSCAEIVQEMERSLGFLTTAQRDLPQRHHSMRAVFEHSWQLLSEAEKRAARRLAVFRGGFRREAAEAVLGGQRPEESGRGAAETLSPVPGLQPLAPFDVLKLLSQLVDKSFLQVTPAGRYEQHPLVHQFVTEKLTARPGEQVEAQTRHGRYYTAFLKKPEAEIRGSRQLEVFAEIDEDLDNIRVAWQWAIEGRRMTEIGQCLDSFFFFYSSRNRYYEAEVAYGQAVDALQQVLEGRPGQTAVDTIQPKQGFSEQETSAVLGVALMYQGACLFYLGRSEPAQSLLERSLDLLHPTGEYWPITFARDQLGLIALSQGRDRQARTYIQEALSLAEKNDDRWLRAASLGCLGHCVRGQDYAAAAEYYRESAAILRELGDWRTMMLSLFLHGEMTRLCGELAEAKAIFEEGLAFTREAGYPQLIVSFLAGLGELALASADYPKAEHYLQECLAIAREDPDCRKSVPDLTCLDDLAEALRNCPTAREYFDESLKSALNIQFAAQILAPLIRLAQALVERSRR